jgi:serine/threonine protein kinase
MEQHVENILKMYVQRMRRRTQFEEELSQCLFPQATQTQLRRMMAQKESNYLRLRRARIDRSMFEHVAMLGTGAFGQVDLVRKRDSGVLFALKTLRKKDVLRRNQVAHVKAERDILAEADNEWVVKLYYSFQVS